MEEALRQASPNDLYRFLNWCCKLQHGKNGRKLKGYTKASSLKGDWKYFRGYYAKVTGGPIGKEMGGKLLTVCFRSCPGIFYMNPLNNISSNWQGIRRLIKKHGLDTQPRDNIPVYVEDMIPLNETILQTRKKRFYLGLQRIMLCTYGMMGVFSVNRKTAILHLQYKHLLITLQRNPHGGPPVPSIDIRPEHVKKFLGTKDLYVTVG